MRLDLLGGVKAETEEAYQANLKQAQVAQKEFEDKVRHLDQQLSQVKIKEAQAEAASALSNVAFKVAQVKELGPVAINFSINAESQAAPGIQNVGDFVLMSVHCHLSSIALR